MGKSTPTNQPEPKLLDIQCEQFEDEVRLYLTDFYLVPQASIESFNIYVGFVNGINAILKDSSYLLKDAIEGSQISPQARYFVYLPEYIPCNPFARNQENRIKTEKSLLDIAQELKAQKCISLLEEEPAKKKHHWFKRRR